MPHGPARLVALVPEANVAEDRRRVFAHRVRQRLLLSEYSQPIDFKQCCHCFRCTSLSVDPLSDRVSSAVAPPPIPSTVALCRAPSSRRPQWQHSGKERRTTAALVGMQPVGACASISTTSGIAPASRTASCNHRATRTGVGSEESISACLPGGIVTALWPCLRCLALRSGTRVLIAVHYAACRPHGVTPLLRAAHSACATTDEKLHQSVATEAKPLSTAAFH
jgi:hypothetical protein